LIVNSVDIFVRKARKHVNPLNIQHLALIGHALTTDFSSLARILPAQLVILPSPVLGWLSIAQFDQGFQEKAPSEQPLPLTGKPHIVND